MSIPRRRAAAAALALVAGLSLATATAAGAAPKPKAPVPAVVKVASQVQLRVTPVAKTPAVTDYTAVVTVKAPANTLVTGTYQVLEGGVVLGSGTLAKGTGTLAVDLPAGTHTLVAVYSGTAKINGASTKVVEVVVPTV